MKSTRLMLSVAALSAGLIVSGGARAEDWKPVGQAGFLSVGKAYEIEKGHFYWVGEFSGTFFNDKEKGLFDHAGVKCPGYYDFDLNSKKSKGGGYCTLTDLDGDQAFLTWQGTGTVGLGEPFVGTTLDYTGGTGKYKEIKGHNTFVARTLVNWPDGTSSFYSTWNR
jgi:hypothetical protein